MRIITAEELRSLPIKQEYIVPFIEENLTPVGLDFTLGGVAINSTAGERIELEKGEVLEIQHDDHVHVVTAERIAMPSNWFGMIFAKVSLARQGLTPLGTKIDPGFEGNLLLTFTNKANRVIRLSKGDRICNVAFFQIPEPGMTYEPQALRLITERLEPPISFRHELDEADIARLSSFYSRGMIDFYLSILDQFKKQEQQIAEARRDFETVMERFESRANRMLDRIDDFYNNTIIGAILLLAGAIAAVVYGIVTNIR